MATGFLRQGTQWSRIWQLGLLAALIPAGVGRGASPPPVSLERALQQAAPEIIRQLEMRGCRNVGVLKFRVCTGRSISDGRGTFNSYIADRLERTLILANPLDEARQLRLVQQASNVASRTPGASHLSVVGREQLFGALYPPAWGRGSLYVDAFVTGVVQVAPDYRSLRISFLGVQSGDRDLVMLTKPIVAATNGAILNELGESYQLRGGDQSAADAVRMVRGDPKANFPLHDDPAVTLRIFYDGRPVELTEVDGEMVIPEPRRGQTVVMRLERLDRLPETYGAVLKVNGESTVLCQTEPDSDCLKRILEPNAAAVDIEGYETGDREHRPFSIADESESRSLEMYYGRDVGTISLTVFRELRQAPPPRPELPSDPQAEAPADAATELPDDLAAIAKAGVPLEAAEDLPSLQEQVRKAAGKIETRGEKTPSSLPAGVNERGVMQPGQAEQSDVEWTARRDWEPEPILSAVIRYYRPRGTVQGPARP